MTFQHPRAAGTSRASRPNTKVNAETLNLNSNHTPFCPLDTPAATLIDDKSLLLMLLPHFHTGAGGMSSGGPPDDEYAMFGLSMVHRAVLAGGAVLQSHEALLTLLHKDLFAAMVVAVSVLL